MQTRKAASEMTVVDHPRVASDGARAIVRAAGSPHYERLATRVLNELGSEYYGRFADTRQRLLTALVESGEDQDAADLETGEWQRSLQELLRTRPELTPVVQDLSREAVDC